MVYKILAGPAREVATFSMKAPACLNFGVQSAAYIRKRHSRAICYTRVGIFLVALDEPEGVIR